VIRGRCAPFAKPPARVVIRASAECSTIGSGRIVAQVKPSRHGTFTATFTLAPSLAGHAIVFLCAGTKVRATAASRRNAPTFTLIRGVRTG
jgi:hypothetical protein